MNEGLRVWVIYGPTTSDHPGKWVVRLQIAAEGVVLKDPHCSLHDSLEEARDAVPAGLYRMGRQQEDDPVIEETWF